MATGLAAGFLWALDTVILGLALALPPFSLPGAVLAAPVLSAWLHDLFSALWMLAIMAVKRETGKTIRALCTRSGKFIVLGALLGGPVGMFCYVSAIGRIGPAYTAMISACFPALGALGSVFFLKEKMTREKALGLGAAILGTLLLGAGGTGEKDILGFILAAGAAFGWAAEAVICTYGMRDPEVTNEHALQIRQSVSAITYTVLILPLTGAMSAFSGNLPIRPGIIIALAALAGTCSYLCYYRALHRLGTTRAMALDITYSAFAVVLAIPLTGVLPTLKEVLCALLILAGSALAGKERT